MLDAASFLGASVVVPSYTSTVNSALNVERVLSSCKKISSFPEAHSAASSANGDQVSSTTQSAYKATEYDPPTRWGCYSTCTERSGVSFG